MLWARNWSKHTKIITTSIPHWGQHIHCLRGLELKWWSGCVVLYLAFCAAAMVFFGTQAEEVRCEG